MRQSATSLLEGGVDLFSLPDIYFQVTEMISDSRFSLKDIGQVIAKDPALSARLLKIVNSPIYGYQGKIDTISRAIVVVGIEDLNHLVLATSVVDSFKDIPNDLIDMTSFWVHSINTGLLAKMLAQKSAVLHSERLFLSGLLHNIGSLVMFCKAPEKSRRTLQMADNDRNLVALSEIQVFGFTHAEVSSELLKFWNMPEALSESIACYIQPELSHVHRLDTHILSVAVNLANTLAYGGNVDDYITTINETTLSLIRLSGEQISEISGKVSDEFPAIFNVIAPNKKFH